MYIYKRIDVHRCFKRIKKYFISLQVNQVLRAFERGNEFFDGTIVKYLKKEKKLVYEILMIDKYDIINWINNVHIYWKLICSNLKRIDKHRI